MSKDAREQFISELQDAISSLNSEKEGLVAKLPQAGEYIEEAIRILKNYVEDFTGIPRICVIGSTGMGKSSLINHIFATPVAKVNPTRSETQNCIGYKYPETDPYVEILDTRGLNEIFSTADAERQLLQDLTDRRPHLVIYVTDAMNRAAVDRELQFLKQLVNECKNIFKRDVGCVIFANRADGITPSGFSFLPPEPWQKPQADEIKQITVKRKNLIGKMEWFEELIEKTEFHTSPKLLPIALQWNPEKIFWNHKSAMQEVFTESSPALLYAFGRTEQLKDQITQNLEWLCEEIVIKFSVLSATVCWNPIPISDAAILCPLQITMLKLLKIIGNKGSLGPWEIFKFVGLGSQAGKLIVNQLLKFFPGIGNALNSATAASITYSIGKMGIAHFVKGWGKDQLETLKDITQFKNDTNEFLKKFNFT